MHPDAAVRRRALCPKELVTAYAGAQEVSGTARCWKDCAHHPVALAIYAARKARWQFVNAVTLRDASGQERSLVHGSPAVLRQLLLQDLRSSNASRDAYTAAQRLETPSHLAEDLRRRGVWLLPVQKLLRSRASGGLTGNEATRLVQATTGQLWTGAVLARRGILASPDCPHCGAEDTVFHRVWICPFGQNVREVVASADLIRAAVAAGPTSPLFARALAPHPVEPEAARSDGLVVHWARTIDGEGAFRAQQGPIFVDGSAVNPHHPAIASAACAAVQVDVEGKVLVSLRAAVPRGWPQTAACAERLVIGLVAQFVHGHCDIYSDCQGVVQEWNQPARSTDARAVWGGLWRQILQTQAERRRSGGIGHIFKCKAHQLKEVCERGDPHDLYVWHGNDAPTVLPRRLRSPPAQARPTSRSTSASTLAPSGSLAPSGACWRFGPPHDSFTRVRPPASVGCATQRPTFTGAGTSGASASPVDAGSATFACARLGNLPFGAGVA